MIVSKFGGSASAHSIAVNNIKNLSTNTDRRVLIFSAIGKSSNLGQDSKVTDLLFGCVNNIKNVSKTQDLLQIIIDKYQTLCKYLNIKVNTKKIINNYYKEFCTNRDIDWFVSRGEYLTACLYSKALNIKFVPADKVIFFDDNHIDFVKTKKRLSYYLSKYSQIILPGFYGKTPYGKIRLFSRGGSDITGAIVAKVLAADFYENWTDVSGIKPINPNIMPSPTIQVMSYQDLYVMTNYDAKVIHHDCVPILQNSQVVLKVANIFDLQSDFTIVGNMETYNKFVSYKVVGNSVEIATRLPQGNLQTYILPIHNLNQQLQEVFNSL